MSGNVLSTPEKAFLIDFMDRNAQGIATLSDALFYFGELGMQEFRSAELMCSLLEEHGFAVERNLSGFPTGFLACYGEGAPVVGIHTEYDANPANSQASGLADKVEIVEGAPGHCEGHNANAAVMVAAAIGLRHAMEKFGLKGTIKIIGAPSEETLISRPYFVRDGVFDDIDVVFHDHVWDDLRADYGHIQYAAISADFTFHGESAHAALFPFRARDALDAVTLMDMGMAQYREHFEPQMSAQRTITNGGKQPNVIPDLASVWWYFRHPHADGTRRLFEQAKRIAQGAAMMTNTEVEVNIRSAVWPVMLNRTASEVAQRNAQAVGMPVWTADEDALAKTLQVKAGKEPVGLLKAAGKVTGPAKIIAASNDSGDVSCKVPMARIWFPSNVPNLGFHHWTAGAALATSIAHKGAIAGAKVLGASVIDYLTDDGDLMERTRESFAAELSGIEYEPLLPKDQQPPLDLNRAEMEKYRAQMEAHYVAERPKFVA